MSSELYRDTFLEAADHWVCKGYSIDLRYMAYQSASMSHLLEASITLNPLPILQETTFRIEAGIICAGQLQLSTRPKKQLFAALNLAMDGAIHVVDRSFGLNTEQPLDFYSEMIHRDRWYCDLHLQVIDRSAPQPTPIEGANIDGALRRSSPPFDGLTDLSRWLGLADPRSHVVPSIKIRVGPPVDLIFPSGCSLENGLLRLTLHAHPQFDEAKIGLAVLAVPGNALASRMQVASEIKWSRVRNGRREGIALIRLDQADSALVMLMIGETTVRRQWFVDATRARNNRLVAMQNFDKDLHRVRQAVLEPSDSMKFEVGVAALLFLLGFSPAVQLETDSPDLVVATPGGKLIVVECTTKIADFSQKLGKLVDRRVALSKALQNSGHYSRVDAILVCAQPRDQIAVSADELNSHQVLLVTKFELARGFEQLRMPSDPDELLDGAVAKLAQGHNALQL